MKDKIDKLKKLLDKTELFKFDKISESSFLQSELFELEIIDSIKNNKTDFELDNFKQLKTVIKSATKVDNLFNNLEVFKNKLKDKNIDYKSTFFVRVVTSKS